MPDKLTTVYQKSQKHMNLSKKIYYICLRAVPIVFKVKTIDFLFNFAFEKMLSQLIGENISKSHS